MPNGEITLSDGETIKLVGYSMGAAYAAGMASVLANSEYKDLLQFVDYIAPHQPNRFEHPKGVFGRQFGSEKDNIIFGAGKTKIKNIDDINHHLGNFEKLTDVRGHLLGNGFDLNKFIMDVINAGGTVTVH